MRPRRSPSGERLLRRRDRAPNISPSPPSSRTRGCQSHIRPISSDKRTDQRLMQPESTFLRCGRMGSFGKQNHCCWKARNRSNQCAGPGGGAPARHKCNDNWALIFPGNMPKKAPRCVSGALDRRPWLSGGLIDPAAASEMCLHTRGTVSIWGR